MALLVLLVGVGTWAADDPVEARMRKDITYLASDECEGRGVDTKGIHKAADYIAEEFKRAGLKPVTENPGYFQPFSISGGSKLESPNTLVLRGPKGQEIELEINKQFRPMGLTGAGNLTNVPIVFAGYGVVAPDIGYDDFKDVNVEGKIIVVIRKVPRAANQHTPFDGAKMNNHQGLQTKISNGELKKAAAILLVNDADTAKNGDPLMDFNYTASAGGSNKLPAIHVKRSVLDPILQSSLGAGIPELERDIDADLKPRSAALEGWTASLEVNVKRQTVAAKNIVGVLEGAGPLAKETVVIGAHYDHLGYGGFGSLAKNLKGQAIHYGADDNGSGTTTIMELARRFGAKKDREGRRLVFIAFSGEERGLLGSEHYCRNPLLPLDATAAMVNLDMVGRLRADEKTNKDKLTVYGTGTAKTFDKLIDSLNEKYQFQMAKVPGGMGPSDHASFYMRKIPVFFLFTNDHSDYHRPSDTADKINVPGMKKIADLTTDLVEQLATMPQRPEYVQVAGGGVRSGPAGPRIGIRPDYGSEKEGVLIGGVTDGGPAQKAGLKAGDIITEVGGKPAKSLETYMVLMSAYKKGDKVELTVQRDGQKKAITVVPE
ncbi:hypothetical protein AYO44_14795 [Planctomycetaceae bacterium SCGC AG-212-F19]|nr:hypothetical protein AYO44_14795 [Planctomycetaceae bacterium SCGC AG-212-F19]